MNRWVKIYESIMDNEWAHKPEYFAFMVKAILKANPNEWKWEGNTLPKGSFVTSIKKFADVVGISEQTCRTIFKNLQKCEFLNIKSTNKYTIVYVCKYERYQQNQQTTNKQLTNKQQTTNEQLTNEQQTTNKQLTTDIEYKNIEYKEIKNKDFLKHTHTEIFQNFLSLCGNASEAKDLQRQFIAYNAEKNQTWWDVGLWKNHTESFFRKSLKKTKKTNPPVAQPPRTAPQPQEFIPDAATQAVWDKISDELKSEIGFENWKKWIKPVKPISVKDKLLTIKVPSKFVYEELEKNFVSNLKKSLNNNGLECLEYTV